MSHLSYLNKEYLPPQMPEHCHCLPLHLAIWLQFSRLGVWWAFVVVLSTLPSTANHLPPAAANHIRSLLSWAHTRRRSCVKACFQQQTMLQTTLCWASVLRGLPHCGSITAQADVFGKRVISGSKWTGYFFKTSLSLAPSWAAFSH